MINGESVMVRQHKKKPQPYTFVHEYVNCAMAAVLFWALAS